MRKMVPPTAMPAMAPVERGFAGAEGPDVEVGIVRVGVRTLIDALRASKTGRSRFDHPAEGELAVAPPCGLRYLSDFECTEIIHERQ